MSNFVHPRQGFIGMLGAWFFRPILNLLRWLGVKPLGLTHQNSINVFIKISEGSENTTVPMDLPKDWTVGQVKEYLADTLGKSASGFRIILAGKELHNNVKVIDCDLGPQTVIHAIRVVYESVLPAHSNVPEPSETPMNACLMDLQLTKEEQTLESERIDDRPKRKAHFFVYCDAASCRNTVPQPGKLRVRCSLCREGSVVVLSDPCSWEDVLRPGRIQGHCQNGLCRGAEASERDPESPKIVSVDFYFKCHGLEHRSDEEGQNLGEAPPLHLIRPNVRQIPCLSCGDVLPDDGIVVVFDCADQHVICLDCFKLYCLSRLNERQFVLDQNLGYTLGCPVGCAESLISQLKHFKVLDGHDYNRYHRFAAEESVLQSGGVLCPQPGCGMGILTDERRVVCTSCQFVFCRLCQQGFHIGDCIQPGQDSIGGNLGNEDHGFEMDPQRVSRARWVDHLDPSSVVAIRLTTKPCPKCRTPTERDGGCMHMACTKAGCGFQWCWVCQTEWSRDCMANHWFG